MKCLCGASVPGAWTAGVHHGAHRCARVVTRLRSIPVPLCHCGKAGNLQPDDLIACEEHAR
jgi:hypothetical protein